MVTRIGIKYKSFSQDINEKSGFFTPLHELSDKLPKELVELDCYYLGDGRNGKDCRIWMNERDRILKMVLELVDGEIEDEHSHIIKCNRNFGDDFGKYLFFSHSANY